ncbi:sialidase family protein [Ruania halotolerans]|uniref:sialidase family protein n=1 Tax=Ruania halotolerans TaxID=2897773 RepID=UPI001E537A72|nr:sialidase family protein [Ruania halotolerans]UFU06075.1 glycoside hydrolase [Ruania halotolerans]
MTVATTVPGTVIGHSPASSRAYVGSPTIVVLPDGDYLAGHDLFGPGTNFDTQMIYGSTDQGATWTHRATLTGQFWSTLFLAGGSVWTIGASRQYGNVVIRRSDDGGHTWTEPTDEANGLIRSGTFHTAPTPVLEHEGRWWRAIEDVTDTSRWGRSFRAGMLSAPVGADLLDARSWTSTPFEAVDPGWLGGTMNAWLEGNAVVGPDGQMMNVMRVDEPGTGEHVYSALLRVPTPDGPMVFDPEADVVPMPGGISKFTIRWDEPTGRYHALVNHVAHPERAGKGLRGRHVLCHATSPDLRTWQVGEVLLEHEDDADHGFQYVDWVVEGEDILFVSRTAYEDSEGSAENFHDSNYMTFHRFPDFRSGVQGVR